jgi:hypothetical protein
MRDCRQAAEMVRAGLVVYDAFLGTFFPSFRALDKPIAIACFRLFTLPSLPLFAVPRL